MLTLPGCKKIRNYLISDPAHPLTLFPMKKIDVWNWKEEVIFKSIFNSARKQVECAFGRLKWGWVICHLYISFCAITAKGISLRSKNHYIIGKRSARIVLCSQVVDSFVLEIGALLELTITLVFMWASEQLIFWVPVSTWFVKTMQRDFTKLDKK